MSSLAETARIEWMSTWAFAHRNIIMAQRNVFFLFELTFWPGVAMLSHGLLTRFLDRPEDDGVSSGGIVSLPLAVCQLDVAYACCSTSVQMEKKASVPGALRSITWRWVVARRCRAGIIVLPLMAWIGAWALASLIAGPVILALFLLAFL